MKSIKGIVLVAAVLISLILLSANVSADVERVKYQAEGNYLIVEVLDDDLIHFEYGRGTGPDTDKAIETTDMVCKDTDNLPQGVCKPLSDFTGSETFSDNGAGVLETEDIRLHINISNLFATVIDKTKNNLSLTTISAENLHQARKRLVGTRSERLDVYGLGQQFIEPGRMDIDWDRRVREGGEFGNVMAGFNGGANGNTQIPVMYAVNEATFENYALLLDNIYRQRWDFTSTSQWQVEVNEGQIRFFIMAGPDLLDLRKDYMELVGRPLVPPKKMFGLWISEYGYDDWHELEDKLRTLQENKFPVDGFVLDLQWFGGITQNSDYTRMGALTFDDVKFPNPSQKISELQNDKGIGIMLIEEAYVGRALPEHADLHSYGCLVTDRPGGSNPAYIVSNPWWGKGGMIDYTSDSCSQYWHDSKRQPLIDKGVIGHWTDLGEPEMFNPDAGYSVGTHADAHNIFNFRWIRGIYKGYLENNVSSRPFIMSRSGTAGIQRFGAAMWSGDIGSRLENLASHAANQMHMSLSGIDYYGSDIGGFHRGDLQNPENRDKLKELYTHWYAYGTMFDIPGRPHTENLCNCKETAPDRVGDLRSNLENTYLRYKLIPYVYSLAHRANRYGEPLMPPPFMYYQTDNNFRSVGSEKMIGCDLLASVISRHDQTSADVRLPHGTWIDWHTNERFISTERQSLVNIPVCRNGVFSLPLFAREGAIIPLMFVDENTMNALGKRRDGLTHDELIVKAFSFDGDANDGEGKSSFTLYEDDGVTTAYLTGAVRETNISQERKGNIVTVRIHNSTGTYQGAPGSRNNIIELVVANVGEKVSLNGVELREFSKVANLKTVDSGWVDDEVSKTMIAKSGTMSVSDAKEFVFTLGEPRITPTPTPTPIIEKKMYLRGTFNNWSLSDPMFKNPEGVWEITKNLSAGRIEYKFDTGKWTTNENWGHGDEGTEVPQSGYAVPNAPNIVLNIPATGEYTFKFNEASRYFSVTGVVGPVTTTFKVHYDVGFGNNITIRGSIPQLNNWQSPGKACTWTEGNVWVYEATDIPEGTKFEWKTLINDTSWSEGANYEGTGGETMDVYPVFEKILGVEVTPTQVTPSPGPTPTPPGFEAVFVIAGLLAVAYLIRRRKR
ncbi:MAG: TIM-barrel domain-containing protein [Halobacteriota archaeon]